MSETPTEMNEPKVREIFEDWKRVLTKSGDLKITEIVLKVDVKLYNFSSGAAVHSTPPVILLLISKNATIERVEELVVHELLHVAYPEHGEKGHKEATEGFIYARKRGWIG